MAAATTLCRKSILPVTLRELEAMGYRTAKVEYWSPFPKPHGKRHDLFNCIDALGVHPEQHHTIGVQATSRSNSLARLKKIMYDEIVFPQAKDWLAAGNRLEVWGIDKYKNRARILIIRLEIDWIDGDIVEYEREERV